MATDIEPRRAQLDLENEKFGTNLFGNTVVRVDDETGSSFANALLQLSYMYFTAQSLNDLVIDNSGSLVITNEGLLVESP